MQVLLVDDEITTIQALAQTIPWEELGFRGVLQAASAQKALELFEGNQIAIVITDIRMPGMTGLEMIDRMREINKYATYILLTGHSDFTYTQKAIQLRADSYLLKPVADDDLIAEIVRVSEIYKGKWKEHASIEKARQQIELNLPFLRNHFFSRLLKGVEFSPIELEKHVDMLSLQITDEMDVQLMLLRIETANHHQQPNEGAVLLEYAVTNLIQEHFSFLCTPYSCRDPYDYIVFFLFAKGRPRLSDIATQAQTTIKHMLGCSVSVVLSQWGHFPDDIQPQYHIALSALWRMINNDSEMFITQEELPGSPSDQPTYDLVELYRIPSLLKLAESGQWDEVETRLSKSFDELRAKYAGSKEHHLEMFTYVSAVLFRLVHKGGVYIETMTGVDIASLQKTMVSGNISALERWVASFIAAIRESTRLQLSEERNSIIQHVHAYVEENLDKDTSLQTISDAVHIHPVYLSKVYKIATGENLSGYILRLKMTRAAQLLQNSRIKIQEVGKATGYDSISYFGKVFKRYYGLSPQEYREEDAKASKEPE